MHSLPQGCRGVLVSVIEYKEVMITCLSCLSNNKVKLYFWKKRMIFIDKFNLCYPDFCVVTHNQRRCFSDLESSIDISKINMLFLNQINGLMNNVMVNIDTHVDKVDLCYQSSVSGPDIFWLHG